MQNFYDHITKGKCHTPSAAVARECPLSSEQLTKWHSQQKQQRKAISQRWVVSSFWKQNIGLASHWCMTAGDNLRRPKQGRSKIRGDTAIRKLIVDLKSSVPANVIRQCRQRHIQVGHGGKCWVGLYQLKSRRYLLLPFKSHFRFHFNGRHFGFDIQTSLLK